MIPLIIPVRLASSRLPRKPFALISGTPMLEHVYKNAVSAVGRDLVFVAGCDAEVQEFCDHLDAHYISTSPAHSRATDRTAEAIGTISEGFNEKITGVIMLQGDEPALEYQELATLQSAINMHPESVLNLSGKFLDMKEIEDPNSIKVVLDGDGKGMFMTRAPIPSGNPLECKSVVKQVCAMYFPIQKLEYFTGLEESPLEISESIDMLRFLENGVEIRFIPSPRRSHPVDVRSDIKVVENILALREQKAS